ncbi:NAD(P)H-dependent oxidoreductase [bacterium]|nr:NAD(P)H-dependent oxidoreductase [bacterium]
MQLTIFNGSPRGKRGNTEIMLNKILTGFENAQDAEVTWVHLNSARQRETAPEIFRQSDLVLLGIPLYTDAMPGLVKAFIEGLARFVGQEDNPKMAFLVQSGFPEAHHSRFVERYLEKLARRLGSPYAGTIVKGNCEGVRMMPEQMNQKLFNGLIELGADLAREGQFDPEKLTRLAKPERYPAIITPLAWLVLRLPMMQGYWNNQLKKNGAYEERFARPFEEG